MSERLQAVSVVDEQVVWVSGLGGTWARTTDGGATWTSGVVPGADSLQFRDVHAVDGRTAYLLSAGPGAASRIYKTTDSGATWRLQFVNPVARAFFDCFDFWDGISGIAFSDAVDGEFVIVTTDDGETWMRLPPDALPAAQPGEGGFAASGTCVVALGDGTALIGTGNAARARLLATPDRGHTWSVRELPVAAGEGAGVVTLAFRTPRVGLAAGGTIGAPLAPAQPVAVTRDGGVTWRSGGRPTFLGPVYGTAYVPRSRPPIVVAVGPGGAAYSSDDGATWTALDTLEHWAVAFASRGAGWMVGPDGRITKIRFR